MKRILLIVSTLLLFGAGLYRWVDEQGRVHYSDVPPKGVLPKVEPEAPAADSAAAGASAPSSSAISVRRTFVLYDVKNLARPSFRLVVLLNVAGGEDATVEAEFENPADAAQPLRGARLEKSDTSREQFMIASPELAAIQCRSYDVTVRVERGGEAIGTVRERIVSRMDSASVAAGGADAVQRLQRGERVCPGA